MPQVFTSATDIRVRMEDIILAHPHVVTIVPGVECPLLQETLPAVQVIVRPGAPQMTNRDRRLVTRTFDVVIYTYRICNGTAQEFRDAYESAEMYADLIGDALAPSWPNLRLNDNGLPGIVEVKPPADVGPSYRDWDVETYGVVHSPVQVVYYRPTRT